EFFLLMGKNTVIHSDLKDQLLQIQVTGKKIEHLSFRIHFWSDARSVKTDIIEEV
ncbi:hypothetical protein L9F63_002516, partial [Diploptera punctata]